MADEKKTTRKAPAAKRAEHRPRIDAVLRAIKEGRYDDELNTMKGAIDDRNRIRQEKVLALVHETFGDEYVVAPKPSVRPRSVSAQIHEEVPTGWKDNTEKVAVAEGEVVSSDGPTATMTIEGEDEDGFESRSPLIGPVNPS